MQAPNTGVDRKLSEDLLKCAGKKENILKHADEEDIATLRQAGFLASNIKMSQPGT